MNNYYKEKQINFILHVSSLPQMNNYYKVKPPPPPQKEKKILHLFPALSYKLE
jgi:hypothetical protein